MCSVSEFDQSSIKAISHHPNGRKSNVWFESILQCWQCFWRIYHSWTGRQKGVGNSSMEKDQKLEFLIPRLNIFDVFLHQVYLYICNKEKWIQHQNLKIHNFFSNATFLHLGHSLLNVNIYFFVIFLLFFIYFPSK